MNFPVLIPNIFDYPFTYTSDINLNVGDYVEVPFGKKKINGVVWNEFENNQSKNFTLKKIIKKLDVNPLKLSTINFLNWFSSYNIVPKGMALKLHLLGNNAIENKSNNNFIEYKPTVKSSIYQLNSEQLKCFSELLKKNNKFKVSVLQGTTGSGKTLVYFERINRLIQENKQALILIPEIFLTTQFKNRFKLFFGFEPAIWHSKISINKKKDIWLSVAKNKIKIVLGARSALFLPFKNLGLIIVDEEHDSSYKQEDSVIYNARDMAISRASIENIPIHLVTSIPSLETYRNIEIKKYNKTELKNRFENFPLPKTKIINLNLESLNKKSISEETIKIVKSYLEKKNQVLFFLNRRGYSPFLICKKCGYRHVCPNCSIYLTYHKILGKIICHHCGHKNVTEKKCKDKSSLCKFSMYGPGVEKVFEELKNIFPKKKVKIFSSDYLNKKNNQKI